SFAAGMISTIATTTTPVHSAQPSVYSRSAINAIGSPVADDFSRKPTMCATSPTTRPVHNVWDRIRRSFTAFRSSPTWPAIHVSSSSLNSWPLLGSRTPVIVEPPSDVERVRLLRIHAELREGPGCGLWRDVPRAGERRHRRRGNRGRVDLE